MTAVSAGVARVALGRGEPGAGLFGWSESGNVASYVGAPLFARALVLEVGGRRVGIVVVDLGIVSTALRADVLEHVAALGLDATSLVLSATHTHSGPSGISTHLFHALAAPGVVPETLLAVRQAIVLALSQAVERLQAARFAWAVGHVPLTDAIAWNRALDAYNRNPDVTPVAPGREDSALDRRMTVLRVDAASGSPIGLVSWFGLHGTCIHGDHRIVHPDHKGEAARIVEEAWAAEGHPDAVALFAQGAAGDVTPNPLHDRQRKRNVGLEPDLAWANAVGAAQARIARRLAAVAEPIDAVTIQCDVVDVHMPSAAIDPRIAPLAAARGERPTTPRLGVASAVGTAEGPGPAAAVPAIGRWAAKAATVLGAWRRAPSDPKPSFVDLGAREQRFLRWVPARSGLLELVRSPAFHYLRRAVALPPEEIGPWAPEDVAISLLRIGPLVVLGVSLEPTTAAALRLEACLLARLPLGSHLVVAGYTNGYAGYLTTPEEYATHGYEGAMTLFGPASWAAIAGSACRLIEGAPIAGRIAPPTLASLPRGAPAHTDDPRESFDRGLPTAFRPPRLGAGAPLSERVADFYLRMACDREEALVDLPNLFSDDIHFVDGFRDVRGMEDFRELFNRMFRQYSSVRFTGMAVEGDDAAFTLTYVMHLQMPLGPSFAAPMMSQATCRNGRVVNLVDRYDLIGSFLSPSPWAKAAYRRVIGRLFL